MQREGRRARLLFDPNSSPPYTTSRMVVHLVRYSRFSQYSTLPNVVHVTWLPRPVSSHVVARAATPELLRYCTVLDPSLLHNTDSS